MGEVISIYRNCISSCIIRARVEAACQRQRERFEAVGAQHAAPLQLACNADMRVAEIRRFCQLDETGESLIKAAVSQLRLSAHGYQRILKLARTIADLAGSEAIQTPQRELRNLVEYLPKEELGQVLKAAWTIKNSTYRNIVSGPLSKHLPETASEALEAARAI